MSILGVVRHRTRLDADAGFTLMEISIGAMLAAIVGTLFLSTLVSVQQGERHLEEVSASQEDLRRAMVEVLQDVRTAEPLWFDKTVTPLNDPGKELRLVQSPAGAAAPTYVRWHLVGGELVRDVVALDAARNIQVVATTYRLPGVDTAITGFAYEHRGGSVNIVDTPATPIDYTQLNHCTVRVTVVLRAATLRGRHPVSVTSQAQLRNNSEPPVGC